MTPTERVLAVCSGNEPDRPPFSFWHHFPPTAVSGKAAVQAHIDHFQTYRLDFLKVMNDNPYPYHGLFLDIADLRSIEALQGNEPGFDQQLDLLSDLRRALGPDALMVTTIFNAWAVLRHIIRPPKVHNPPDLDASHDEPSNQIKSMLVRDSVAVTNALNHIAGSLANFARRCVEAGADGIYLSVRDDWVESADHPGLYDQLVRPADLTILQSAESARFHLLHVCGKPLNLRRFGEYPVHAINWADRAAGPSIASTKEWLKPAICCGIDNLSTLPNGTTRDVEQQIQDALNLAGERPIMISPGCTYDPGRVPAENLKAISNFIHSLGRN